MNCDSVLIGPRTVELAGGLPRWKRVLDSALILLFSPIIVLIGLAISVVVKLGSPGPVLFRQPRVGYKGREFICFKFRTMIVNAETSSHQHHTAQLMKSGVPMTKLDAKKDPRLVPFGAVLRATGLDELPQLINVLRGDMSLVGPRPCVLYEYERYEPWQRRRFDAVPGLTGLWQVSGKNRLSFQEMIQLDIAYSQSMSLWLDLKIIAKTLPALWVQCLDTRAARKQAETSNKNGSRATRPDETKAMRTPMTGVRATVSRAAADTVTSVR